MPVSLDRVRTVRSGLDGIWRIRETGSTISFGTNYSRGLPGLGARTLADANASPGLPLSRPGADAVFNKWDGHIEASQSLPEDFIASLGVYGQSSFNHPMLTSEQFDIDGAKILSGFTAGALAADAGWAIRGELGRTFVVPVGSGGFSIVPYIFEATGERILVQPTTVEIASVHATNYGAGVRFTGVPWADTLPDSYGFIEWSHRYTNDQRLDGDRLFVGMLVRY